MENFNWICCECETPFNTEHSFQAGNVPVDLECPECGSTDIDLA